jgi:allophanate hydrolase subunit 2
MKSKILFTALFVAFLGIANISMASDGGFANKHPRRAEVNQRLRNQHHRIHHKMKNGDISRRQAHRLHHQDHRIRKEERRMAYRHHGHLTRHEKYRLNRQENRVSRRIVKA